MMKKILSCIAVSKFLITTGKTTGYDYIKKSEILDISDQKKFQCADWVDYPIGVYGATGGLVGQVPVICGGWSSGYIDDCYKVTGNKAVFLGKMKTKRYAAASVVLKNTVLWVTGGKDGIYDSSLLSSTEFIHLNGTISNGNSGCRSLKLHTPH